MSSDCVVIGQKLIFENPVKIKKQEPIPQSLRALVSHSEYPFILPNYARNWRGATALLGSGGMAVLSLFVNLAFFQALVGALKSGEFKGFADVLKRKNRVLVSFLL